MRKSRISLFAVIAVLFITTTITSINISNTQTHADNKPLFNDKSIQLKTSAATIDYFNVNAYNDVNLDVTVYIEFPLVGAILNYIDVSAGWRIWYFGEFFNIFDDFEVIEDIKYYNKKVNYNHWRFNQRKAYNIRNTIFDENTPPPSSIDPSDYGKPSNINTIFLNTPADEAEFIERATNGEFIGEPLLIGYQYVRVHASSLLYSHGISEVHPIEDDDTKGPSIFNFYYGDYTDGNPGYIYTIALDKSGIYSHPTQYTYISSELGTYFYTFYATDNDRDWGIYKDDRASSQRSYPVIIRDDDTEGPSINLKYVGSGTDEDPGYILASASDPSGLYKSPESNTKIPSEPGIYTYTFEAIDNDNDRPNDRSSSSKSITVEIVDDDEKGPIISIQYHGEGTDGNPGYVEVTAFDPSGLSVDPSGTYSIPHMIGKYTRGFSAIDNDNDRPSDKSSTYKSFNINLRDDDEKGPKISLKYHGEGTDGNPGYVKVTAFDPSGLSVDPSGLYYLPHTVGWVTMRFTAIDADNDRPGEDDTFSSSKSISIYLKDDDTDDPIINYSYYGDYTDGNPGYILVDAYDPSGLSLDPSGTYELTPILGKQIYEFIAIDNDNDRPLDSLETQETVIINIIDDDIEAPVLYNLQTLTNVYDLNVTFNGYDYSGISSVKVYIDNIFIETFDIIQNNIDDNITISLDNEWIMEYGIHNIKIEVIDGDNDRPDDALSSYIYGTFEITIDNMFKYVLNQIEILKQSFNDILDNYTCKFKYRHHHLSRSMSFKLSKAQFHLMKANILYNEDSISHSIIHDFVSKALIQITEFKTNFLNKIGIITDGEYNSLILQIHNIRNNIIHIMGASVGTDQAMKIADCTIDLLELKDDMDKKIGYHYKKYCLISNLYFAERKLEYSLFKLSIGRNIDRMLKGVQRLLDKTVLKIQCLQRHDKISQELADSFIERIYKINSDIEGIYPPI